MHRLPQAGTGTVLSHIRATALSIKVGPQQRRLQTAHVFLAKALPARTKISDDDIDESFLKGSGPGGQKINKTSSAVQLIHKPTGLVVKAQDTRSREQNRKIARERLGEMIQFREKGEASRMVLKAKAAAKKKSSATKKSRRKYRALAEAKKGAEASSSSNAGEQPGATAAS